MSSKTNESHSNVNKVIFCIFCGDTAKDTKSAYMLGWDLIDNNTCVCPDCQKSGVSAEKSPKKY